MINMRPALYHIFKKNLLVTLSLIILFLLIKGIVALNLPPSQGDYEKISLWAKECDRLDINEVSEYISSLQQQIYTDPNADSNDILSFSRLNNSYNNMAAVTRLITFAKNGEGALPISLPRNYLELNEFYKNLEQPKIINEQPLNIYFELQRYSLTVAFAILIFSVFLGMHYESGIHRFTGTAKTGLRYIRSLRLCILFLSLGVLFFNELFDMIYSGLMFDAITLNASIQSYSPTCNAQINATVSECLILSFVSKCIGTIFICILTEGIARFTKTVKNSLIFSAVFILAVFLLSSSLRTSSTYSMLQVGIVNWKDVFSLTRIYPWLGVSNIVVGTALNLLLCLLLPVIGRLYRTQIFRKIRCYK